MASQDHGIYSLEERVREGSDYLQQTLGIVYTRTSLMHNEKRIWEQLNINLSPSKEDPSSNEEYEELNS